MPVPGFLAGWGLSPHLREQPLRDRDAALALLPGWMRDSDSTTRDAIADGAMLAINRLASKHAAHAASASPQFATGSRLDLAGTSLGIPRAEGELDAAYRGRLLSSDELATARAILEAVDAILGDSTAYYYERPDDDGYLHTKMTFDAYGVFLGSAPAPIGHPHRLYDERTRCKPRHALLWRKTRGSTPLVSLTVLPIGGSFRVRDTGTDDGTAPDNTHGHVVIGLPAYLQPGRSLPSDCAVHPKAAAVGLLSSIFSTATTATRVAGTRPSGVAVYPSAAQPDIVVGKVRAMLAARSMAPVQYTLLFDPEVV